MTRPYRSALLAVLALCAGALVAPGARAGESPRALNDAPLPGRADTAATPVLPDDAGVLFEMAPPEDLAPILPKILSPGSVELYTRVFEAQEEGKWAEADRLIGKIEDKLLLGHVLAQRYLHSGRRASYPELKGWLDRYADHPGAERIYKLARARHPGGAPPPVPVGERPSPLPQGALAAERRESSPAARKGADALHAQVHAHVRKGAPQAAAKLLEGAEAGRLLGPLAFDAARVRVAQGFYNLGRDEEALTYAVPAMRSLRHLPEAGWLAGLAAWRLDRLDDARRYFEDAAKAANDPWLASAAAFWAARANLVGRRPERVAPWLEAAAQHPRTFYGLLAEHLLGRPMQFLWAEPDLERAEIERLAQIPAGRRAVALVQIGEDRRADLELRRLSAVADAKLARGILALAARADMPALALRLDRQLFPNGDSWMSAAYPLPSWEPENGFRVDPALVYALIHQESGFNPNAKSGAGASGLMQLMPRTASMVARDKAYHRGTKTKKLFSPEVNLTLGQKYLESLIRDPAIAGDLFFIAAAWNGGPGTLSKWWRKSDHRGDPLLFIESIPSRETRIFIERVMANLWIYRHRLGQESPSLAQIAGGDWPTYVAQAGKLKLAAHVQN
ncbi:MAG: lytic transglycosylase domain-containing protein [Rhodospirillales bacterium]|nr:lytic transglycosylase domain-containing protein [Rhodospirillales bacterium]